MIADLRRIAHFCRGSLSSLFSGGCGPDRFTPRTEAGMRRIALFFLVVAVIATVSITQADPGSPFSITNVDTPDPVASGAEITYTITVVNTGGAKTTNVVLSDQLNGVGGIGVPPQLVLTSTRGSCS